MSDKKTEKKVEKKTKIPYHHAVEVIDVDGNTFTINSTHPGPLKVENSHLNHPAYHPDKVLTKKAKGMVEKFNEKMKKIEEKQKNLQK